MKIAIPELDDKIAPCFEAAKQFKIFSIRKGKMISSDVFECHVTDDVMRIRLLRLHDIHTVICNGIKNFFRDQLTAFGITVIPNINEPIEKALELFLSGKLLTNNISEVSGDTIISHDKLVTWAKELFESNGYVVTAYQGSNTYLIDLVATIKCPVCKKNIEIAICCGSQTYSADQEIRELNYITSTRYNSFVYIYPANSRLEKSCFAYGINFISPDTIKPDKKKNIKTTIPILRIPIKGHEKAFTNAN